MVLSSEHQAFASNIARLIKSRTEEAMSTNQDEERQQCIICRGKGFIIGPEQDGDVTCSSCKGTGWQARADQEPLPVHGVVPVASGELRERARTFLKEWQSRANGGHRIDDWPIDFAAAFAASERGQEWVSVKERLPEPDVLVIVSIKGRIAVAVRGAFAGLVDHWMPLPAPPDAKGHES